MTASSGLPVYLDLVHVKAIIPFKHSHLEAAAEIPEGVHIDVYKKLGVEYQNLPITKNLARTKNYVVSVVSVFKSLIISVRFWESAYVGLENS